MAESFSTYDTADYLTEFADAVAYLEAAIDEDPGDPTAITRALGVIARSGNLSELSRRTGISREGLYKALSAEGNPSFATIMAVTSALGLQLTFRTVA